MPLNSADQQPIVDAHNAYRQDPAVNTPNLVWDSTLATGAQSWADNLATNVHNLVHSQSPTRDSNTTGENIASRTTPTPPASAAPMVDMWGKTVVQGRSEQAQFKPGITPNVSKDGKTVGHYTQMIWRTTTKVGCGIASDSTNGTDYFVCRYEPAGNLDGAGVPSLQPVTLAQVSVASSTAAVGVDAANNVYYYSSTDGTNWTPQYSIPDRQMTQVSIASADFTVCGLDSSGNAYQASALSIPFTWTKMTMTGGPAAFISISCAASNNIWAVGTDSQYYQNTGSRWTKIGGGMAGKQVSVASDGTTWGLESSTGYLVQYTANGWQVAAMGGWSMAQISCGSATPANLWAMGLNGQFYQYLGSSPTPGAPGWKQAAPGTGKQVSVASDGTVWSIGTNNQVSRLVNNAWTPLLV